MVGIYDKFQKGITMDNASTNGPLISLLLLASLFVLGSVLDSFGILYSFVYFWTGFGLIVALEFFAVHVLVTKLDRRIKERYAKYDSVYFESMPNTYIT